MVYKNSEVWTMSTEALVAHINELSAPDSIFWDARSLKKEGKKFQNLDWSIFPRVTKINSQWAFA